MPRRKTLQTSFSAGELAPEVAMRQDTDQYQNGAKSLLNRRMLIGGGHVRRPGSWLEAMLPGDPVLAEFIVNQTTQYILAFTDGRMDAYLRDLNSGHVFASGSVTGAPWTGAIFKEMDWVQSGNTIFLTHPAMVTQRIERTGPATWTRSNFAFAIGPAGRPEQPYLKLAANDVTLQPSALTGSVTVTASESVFVPAHLGEYIRYVDRAMQITNYIDTKHVTATVIEQLPGTQTLTVSSSGGFSVGEVVEGKTSTAKGEVTSIPDGTTLTVVLIGGLTPFEAEDVFGPNAKTTISAVANASPAAVKSWDEQLFGPAWGYPSCIELHRNRLLFGGHPAAPDYLIASEIGNLYSFNVGTGADGDAIIESVGDAGASKIVQLFSAEQLLVLTDRGPYYVPEGPTTPFRPSSVAFFPFASPWPITATAQVQAFDSGAIMVSGSLVIKARPTGNLTSSWDADEVSLLAPHLIKTPDRLAVTSNFGGDPERYAAIRNSDGTLAILQLVEAQKIRNLTPWETNGEYLSVASLGGDLYVAVKRTLGGLTKYILEKFDQTLTLDCATRYTSEADMNAGVPGYYRGSPVNVVAGDYHLGPWPLGLRTVPAGPYTVGLYYTSVVQTLPPVITDQEGQMAGDIMRILECYVHVLSSARFEADGYSLSSYQVTDDVSEPPPLKNGPQRFQFAGWEREPTITITQSDPLPLKILAIRTTVAF
jgi:hypothetical protein